MICSDKSCEQDGVKTISNGRGIVSYCWMHHRIRQMRAKARKKGKYAPSTKHLEHMFSNIEDMICPCCGKDMIMHSDLGPMSDVVSLQHNADETLVLICFSCNSAHGQKPGDLYYQIPDGYKHCSNCGDIKLIEKFYTNVSTRDGYQDTCKQCQGEIAKERNKTKRSAVPSAGGWHNAGERCL